CTGALFSQAWSDSIKKKNPSFYEVREAFYKHAEGKSLKSISGWKQFKRWESFMETRVDKAGYLRSDLLWEAMMAKKKAWQMRPGPSTVASTWREIGPKVIPSSGGGAGRLNCVAYNPNNLNIIWVGSPSGGLWKSINGGSTWSSSSDQFTNLGISWIVIDPNNTNIMYLATGDGDHTNSTYSYGVLKSTDGGVNWNSTGLVSNVSSQVRIRKLLMHPSDSTILLAATTNGIFKTSDSGSTWTNEQAGSFADIEVNTTTTTVWYASGYSGAIYKSTDTGDSWSQLSTGLPSPGKRAEIEIAESSPTTVYALFTNSDNGFDGLYRSTNSGANWSLQSDTPNIFGWSDGTGSDDTNGLGFYAITLAVNPTDADEVYVGSVNIWKSTNAGVNWSRLTIWYGSGSNYVHADHHYLEFKPGSSTELISGNDGGFFRSTDSGATWTDSSSGLAIHQIDRLGCSAQNEGTILIGNQDNGTDLLNSSTWTRTYGGDGCECAVDPVTPTTMYCSYIEGDIRRSTNSGASWTDLAAQSQMGTGAWHTPYVLDPNNHLTLYAGTTKVYKSTDQGSN
ncbi:MAG: glycosyl hydrolase, partial [bacterium]|nr:glycosyl hydrolase [bacterium]